MCPSNYVRTERPDGNGFNGGIRLSWKAVTVLIAVIVTLSGTFTTIYGIQAKSIARLDNKVGRYCEKTDKAISELKIIVERHTSDCYAHERIRPTNPTGG